MKLSNDFNAEGLFGALLQSLDEINSEKKEGEDTVAAWYQLLDTMTDEHALILCREFEAAREARVSGNKYNLNPLARAAAWMITKHVQDTRYGRIPASLNLRPDIAKIFLRGPTSIRVCRDCDYRFPSEFKKCPLCFP